MYTYISYSHTPSGKESEQIRNKNLPKACDRGSRIAHGFLWINLVYEDESILDFVTNVVALCCKRHICVCLWSNCYKSAILVIFILNCVKMDQNP